MPDREKVIKCLELCRKLTNTCEGCPYENVPDVKNCMLTMHGDALELLKEKKTENICHKRNARIFACKECGYGIDDIYLTDESNYQIEPVFCPNCGRKVVQ